MKLSEAIRLGAMLHPQYFDEFYDKAHTSSCALGAAADAVCLTVNAETGMAPIRQRWPWLERAVTICPACGPVFMVSYCHLIIHLNDHHRWTREKIADWVESREAHAAPQETNAVDPVAQTGQEVVRA